MKTGILAFALMVSGCSVGTEVKPSFGPRTELHCNGTIPDAPVTYRYTATTSGEAVESSAIVLNTGDQTGSACELGEVVGAGLDFIGDSNGGTFTFFPLGEYLAVKYIDPDQDRYWSLLGCFDG